MKKMITVMAAATLLLTGCSEADTVGATAPTTITELADVRDSLIGTPYECTDWEEPFDTTASCYAAETDSGNGSSRQTVQTTSDGELLAAVTLDNDRKATGVVWGEGWTVKCHHRLEVGECQDIADILGGQVMLRG